MAQSKTPAMILQEYTVKNGLPTPEYNLIQSVTGTHESEFRYQVVVSGVCSVGFGRSKQIAKHNAAQKILELLSEKGLYQMDSNTSPQEFKPHLHRNESENPAEAPSNYLGQLKSLSVEKKLPYPVFNEISDVGPPHARQFTYQCVISSMVTQATANTKKQAKQLCAKEMINKIKTVFPEAVIDQSAENALTESEEKAVNRLASLTLFPDVTVNKTIKIPEYDTVFRKLMDERDLKIDHFLKYFENRNRDSLTALLKDLDLEYKILPLSQKSTVVLSLSISVDVPFTLMKFGKDVDDVHNQLVLEAFKHLELYMKP